MVALADKDRLKLVCSLPCHIPVLIALFWLAGRSNWIRARHSTPRCCAPCSLTPPFAIDLTLIHTLDRLYHWLAGSSNSDRCEALEAALTAPLRPSQSDTSSCLAAGLPARPASPVNNRSPLGGGSGGSKNSSSGNISGRSGGGNTTSGSGSPGGGGAAVFGTAASAKALLQGIRSLAADIDSEVEGSAVAEQKKAAAAPAPRKAPSPRTKSSRVQVRAVRAFWLTFHAMDLVKAGCWSCPTLSPVESCDAGLGGAHLSALGAGAAAAQPSAARRQQPRHWRCRRRQVRDARDTTRAVRAAALRVGSEH